MAFTYGFYNSLNGDRKYNAFQMTQMFDGIILDGVFEAIGQHFAVTPAGGMTLNVGTGRAWFNHTWNDNDSVLPITLPLSDLNRSRYDAVVLEVGDPNTNRTNSIKIVSGAAAVYPTKPLLNRGATNNDTHEPDSITPPPYQHALAYILVKPGVEEIKASDIEIVVGKNETPFVTGPLETRSIEELFNQWDAEFNAWFNNLKAQLSDNVVSNLQRQIDANRNAITTNYNNTLLTDTKNAMHLGGSAIPDAAFKYLLLRINAISRDLAIVTIIVTDQNNLPVKGIEIQNLIGVNGGNVYTNGSGVANGYGAVGNTTFSILDYGDIADASRTDNLIAGGEYQLTWRVIRRNYLLIPGTRSIRFSSDVSNISYTLCGGGGAGGYGLGNWLGMNDTYYSAAGGGGGGGYSVEMQNVKVSANTRYPVTIASGGSPVNYGPGTAGNAGGTSYFMSSAAGGGGGGTCAKPKTPSNDFVYPLGGTGNGNGSNGTVRIGYYGTPSGMTAGGNGTGVFYTSYTEAVTSGGGGGTGGVLYYSSGSPHNALYSAGTYGGYSYGGYGGGVDGNINTYAASGGYGGGGGGGGGYEGTGSGESSRPSHNGARGGNGALAIRINFTWN